MDEILLVRESAWPSMASKEFPWWFKICTTVDRGPIFTNKMRKQNSKRGNRHAIEVEKNVSKVTAIELFLDVAGFFRERFNLLVHFIELRRTSFEHK